MNTLLLTPAIRARVATGAAQMMAMVQVLEVLAAEVEATLTENPTLPRTDAVRFVLWGLILPQISNATAAVEAEAAAQPTEQRKSA